MEPELKAIVAEASQALIRLDADRLEEMALSCEALNRGFPNGEKARQAADARGPMTVFGRVLDATRVNLKVLRRLRELREGRLEYGALELPAHATAAIIPAKESHGND